GKVGVVGIYLERAHATQSMSVRFSSLQQERLQPSKSAGQCGEAFAAGDGIEIDVQGDATLFNVGQTCNVTRRARQRPFFRTEEREAHAAPPPLHVWGDR